MTPLEYTKAALRTEYPSYEPMKKRMENTKLFRLLHAGMGMCTEAGEFVDELKKVIFYGKKMDEVNLAEEIGDLLWYCAVACDTLDIELETVMEVNIDKLKNRYPNKFTEEDALNRNLNKERDVLEDRKSNALPNLPKCGCDECRELREKENKKS